MGKVHEVLKRAEDTAVFYRKEIIFGMIIFIVGSMSFGLGYLANRELGHAPIIIEKCDKK